MDSIRPVGYTRFLEASVVIIVVARLLLPTEETHEGSLLWLSLASFLAFAVSQIQPSGVRISRSYLVTITLLSIGHLLSYIANVAEVNVRHAINMVWEWGGLFCLGILFADLFHSRKTFQKDFCVVVVACTLSLACHGLYQSFIEFPHVRVGLSTEQIASQSLENRLATMGPSIANFYLPGTLGLVLLISYILLLSGFCRSVASSTVTQCVCTSFALVLLFGCILTTQSHAAILLSTIITIVHICSYGKSRSLGLLCAVLLALLIWKLPQSEVFRSVQFRIGYWQSAMEMVLDRPFAGYGPANFRQSYQTYMLASSSEEIFDPHNYFLELWTNGGIAAAAGGILLTVLTLLKLKSAIQLNCYSGNFGTKASVFHVRAAAIGFAMAYTTCVINRLNTNIIWLLPAFFIFSFAIAHTMSQLPDFRLAHLLVIISCLSYLCVNSGIEYPVLVQFVLAFLAMTCPSGSTLESSPTAWRLIVGNALAIISLIFFSTCLMTAVIPISRRNYFERQAFEHLDSGKAELAIYNLHRAANCDPYSPSPWRDAGDIIFTNSDPKDSFRFENDIRVAIDYYMQAIELDPRSPRDYRAVSNCYQKLHDNDTYGQCESAISFLDKAIERYPTACSLLMEMAELQYRCGSKPSAKIYAMQALSIHNVKKRMGHTDQILNGESVVNLKKIIYQ